MEKITIDELLEWLKWNERTPVRGSFNMGYNTAIYDLKKYIADRKKEEEK